MNRFFARIARERFTATALHEAGHAFACFLCGIGLDVVDMKATDARMAEVRHRLGFARKLVCGEIETAQVPDRARMRAELGTVGRQILLFDLLGPSVSNKLEPEVFYTHWLDHLEAETDGDNDDFAQARVVGLAMSKNSEAKALQLMHTIAIWCDELIEIPQVWNTITALATELRYGRAMNGRRAMTIMQKVWGSEVELPLASLGGPWSKRFGYPVLQFASAST